MKNQIGNILKFFLFLGIGLGILYLVYRQQDAAYLAECQLKGIPEQECSLLDKVFSDFASVNYFWIFAVLLAFTTSNVSRAVRWNLLIRPLGYQPKFLNSFFSIMVGYLANLGFPRIGEIVRAGTMSRYENISVEKLMGTIVVGRIFDVFSILIVSGAAFLLEFDMLKAEFTRLIGSNSTSVDSASSFNVFLLIGISLLLTSAVLMYYFRKLILQSKLFRKLVEIVKGFLQGLQSIRHLKNPWSFAFHSLNIWFMYFVMTFLCFKAFAPTESLSAVAGLMVFVFGGWGIVVPSPGGMGTYHFMVITALALYGINSDDAFSFANISFFSINLGCNVLLGILGLILLPIINRGNKKAIEE